MIMICKATQYVKESFGSCMQFCRYAVILVQYSILFHLIGQAQEEKVFPFSLFILQSTPGSVPFHVGGYGKDRIFKCHCTIMRNLPESECDGTGVGM